MVRSPLALRDPDLSGLRVLVVGLGRSGLAAARLARARGADVVACDLRDEQGLGDAAVLARDLGVEIRGGDQSADLAVWWLGQSGFLLKLTAIGFVFRIIFSGHFLFPWLTTRPGPLIAWN